LVEGPDVPRAAELPAERARWMGPASGNGGALRPGRRRHSVRCSTWNTPHKTQRRTAQLRATPRTDDKCSAPMRRLASVLDIDGHAYPDGESASAAVVLAGEQRADLHE